MPLRSLVNGVDNIFKENGHRLLTPFLVKQVVVENLFDLTLTLHLCNSPSDLICRFFKGLDVSNQGDDAHINHSVITSAVSQLYRFFKKSLYGATPPTAELLLELSRNRFKACSMTFALLQVLLEKGFELC